MCCEAKSFSYIITLIIYEAEYCGFINMTESLSLLHGAWNGGLRGWANYASLYTCPTTRKGGLSVYHVCSRTGKQRERCATQSLQPFSLLGPQQSLSSDLWCHPAHRFQRSQSVYRHSKMSACNPFTLAKPRLVSFHSYTKLFRV